MFERFGVFMLCIGDGGEVVIGGVEPILFLIGVFDRLSCDLRSFIESIEFHESPDGVDAKRCVIELCNASSDVNFGLSVVEVAVYSGEFA